MICLVVAGTNSGVGKTSVSLGLMAALRRRGLKVQPFKVGPDYLDPFWHRLAAGRTSYNLDTWMTGADYVRQLFREKSAGADIAIVEGVMGLFDGASPTELEGSTAEVAVLLGAPVLLVASAHGASRSFAATIKGFSEFDPACRISAVIANFCGSKRHASLLEEALVGSGLCPLAGWIPREAIPGLPSRHLGLRAPRHRSRAEAVITALADGIEASVDLDALCDIAAVPQHAFWSQKSRSLLGEAPSASVPAADRAYGHHARLAVAVDEAFDFYYPDNLELLQSLGVEIVPFSPLVDEQVPQDVDGLYFGGGYPEEAAQQLSQNAKMRESIARFAQDGNLIYAECGGMMYLAQTMQDRDGRSWPMAGLLPFDTRMLDRRKRLGYVETRVVEETFWGPPGTTLRGHEFHYSEIVEPISLGDDWTQPYQLTAARGSDSRPGGFARGNVLASYVHQHFQSNPQAAASLACRLLHHRANGAK